MGFDSTTKKLIEIGIDLSAETNLRRLLEKIVLELRTIINADGGSLYLRESQKLRFEVAQNDTLRRQKGKDFLLFKPYEIAVNESSIAGYVALTGALLNIPDVYEIAPDLPYRFNASFDKRNKYRTQSLLAVPLKDPKGDIVGVLEMINALDEEGRVIPFSDHLQELAQALASHAAVAINTARLLQTLEALRAEEKRQYMNHLEAIFQSVKDAIITLSPDWRIVSANQATRAICNVNPEEIVGQDFRNLMQDCQKICAKALMDQHDWGEDSQELRYECRRLSRPHQIVSLTRAPLVDDENKCTGVVLVIRDLTQDVAPAEDLIERYRSYNIIGKSLPMQKLYRQLDNLRRAETTVLIIGETGSGKELVASALHSGGPRAGRAFVKVDCTALAETLLESELFGHVKGAFTGAHKDRVGRLQMAQGGTLFLDEIGDMSLKTQVKLLRAIEEKRFERVGDSTTNQADVRIIAATHHDLRQLVKQTQFREDLFFRLKVVEVNLPPLRDRVDDLPLLVEHFCHVLNQVYNKQVDAVLPEVFEELRSYPWPGNVRELKHVLEYAFVQCHGSTITLDHLPAEVMEPSSKTTLPLVAKKDFSAQELVEVLNKTDWNKSKAARLLGISRPTLYRLLATYNL